MFQRGYSFLDPIPSEHVVALLHNVQVSHYWLVLLLLASRELLVYMKKFVSKIEHSRYV